jgi:hypothetical protein
MADLSWLPVFIKTLAPFLMAQPLHRTATDSVDEQQVGQQLLIDRQKWAPLQPSKRVEELHTRNLLGHCESNLCPATLALHAQLNA